MKFNRSWMQVRRQYDRREVLGEDGQVISAVYREKLPRPDRPTLQVPSGSALGSVALLLSAGLGFSLGFLVLFAAIA